MGKKKLRKQKLGSLFIGFLFLAFYLCLFLAAVMFLNHWHYRFRLNFENFPKQRLFEMAANSGIKPELLHSVGYFKANPNKESRFVRYSQKKRPGTIRIGAFGDSFTWGDEVGSNLDFPHLLQKLFDSAGYRNVEVLNFGSSWHGFGQAYRIWEQLGVNYDLDFILLGPAGFFYERDQTFNHSQSHSPYYIHGRYIMGEPEPKFLDVLGELDYNSRFNNYFSFFPSKQYLLFDRNPPTAVQAILPEGRTLPNPFYYTFLSPKEEGARIYGPLLRKMARDAGQVILLQLNTDILDMANHLDAPLVTHNLLAIPNDFPYYRVGHFSSFGNELVAKAYFDILTRQPQMDLSMVHFTPVQGNSGEFVDLSRWEAISLSIGDSFIGGFFHNKPGIGFGADSPVSFSQEGIRGLVSLGPQDKFFDFPMFPLKTLPNLSSRLWLSTGRSTPKIEIGKCHFVGDQLPICRIDFGQVKMRRDQGPGVDPTKIKIEIVGDFAPPNDFLRSIKRGELFLDQESLGLISKVEPKLFEIKGLARPLFLRADQESFMATSKMTSNMAAFLSCTTQGKLVQRKLARAHLESRHVTYSQKGLHTFIRKGSLHKGEIEKVTRD